jgi:hypothetical protein
LKLVQTYSYHQSKPKEELRHKAPQRIFQSPKVKGDAKRRLWLLGFEKFAVNVVSQIKLKNRDYLSNSVATSALALD